MSSILEAFGAAVASGLAVVLQGVAARREPPGNDLSVGFLWRLVRRPVYLGGIALTGLGFLLALAALRELPLFVVQAVRASSLAVTAVAAVLVFGAALRRSEVVALATAGAGLALLGLSAETAPPPPVGGAGSWLLPLAVVALAAVAGAAARRTSTRRGLVLGVVAGCGFAVLGIAARVIVVPGRPLELLADVAMWVILAAGGLGLVAFALATRRAGVTTVTVVMVATETLVASAVGLLLLGDAPAADRWPVAVLGFAATLVGALGMARPAGVATHPG